jgi:hypothetical protein
MDEMIFDLVVALSCGHGGRSLIFFGPHPPHTYRNTYDNGKYEIKRLLNPLSYCGAVHARISCVHA